MTNSNNKLPLEIFNNNNNIVSEKIAKKRKIYENQTKESSLVKTATLIRNFIFLIALLPLGIFAQMEKEKIEEKLKNLSLEEAKLKFIETSSEISKTVSSLENFKSLRISGGSVIDSKDEETINNFSIDIKDSIRKGFLKLIHKYSIEQERGKNQSFIKRTLSNHYGITKEFKKIYQDFYNDSYPEITYNKAYFFDGSSKKWGQEEDSIKSIKKIDSISVTATYYYPTIDNVMTLDTQTKKNKQVVFTQEKSDTYKIYLNTSLNKNLIYVEALNKEGKALRQKSGYTSTVDMPNVKFLKDLANYFNKIVTEITNKKIKTKKELISKLSKTIPNEDNYINKTAPKTLIYNTCRGNVSQVKLYFGKKRNSETIDFIIPNDTAYENNLSVEYYYDGNNMYGIMDFKGNWVIKPIANHMYNVIGNYYKINDKNYANDKLYYLNLKTKKLELPPFFMFSPKLYNKDHVSITKESNSKAKQGLVNYKTQEVILEAKYGSIDANNTFYCVKETQKSPYEIYRFSDNKKIKTGNFEVVNLYDDYFLGWGYKFIKDKYISLCNFYNYNGGKINTIGISDIPSIYSFGKDNLLPVTDINGDEYYIQKKGGKAPINLENYKKIGAFSYGLAPVQHKENNLYGFINTKGKLKIPCTYKFANIFIGGTAYVRNNDSAVLINLKNETVFEFPGDVSSYDITPDADSTLYTIYKRGVKRSKYNHKGEKYKSKF